MNKFLEKWKKKKIFDKVTDILFIALVITMLIPSGRMAITVTVKRLFAFSPKVVSTDDRIIIGQKDYDWTLESLSGELINLEEYRGKVLFINLWATWCPPCVAEMPSIQKLYDQFRNDDQVKFLLVTSEDELVVRDFVEKGEFDFPVYLTRSNTPLPFYSNTIPATFLVSSRGKIALDVKGSRKWHGEETVELIESLKEE